ncbi:MAG: hypothetical protein FJW39_22890 [Acidobacteria bacterium]|nr:hypothetical protein [Acidobacteriota bacterium]
MQRVAAGAAFLGGFLLFAVQMIAGRLLLPGFGGGPAVWTACLLFFQCALLAGYMLAHFARPVPWLGLAALPLLVLPGFWRPHPGGLPTVTIFSLLSVNIGLPYLMLAAGSPWLQKRLSNYGLYSWSNLGSVASVLLYLTAAEPLVRLRHQTWIWAGLYTVWVVLIGIAARGAAPAPEPRSARPRIDWRWIALPAAGSALLTAATNQLSQEVFVTPLLWVLPLVVYLATYAAAFRTDQPYNRRVWAWAAGACGSLACVAASMGTEAPLWLHLVAYPAALLACCMCVHGELAAARPETGLLTDYYLAIAGGGALGSALVAVAAPMLINYYGELFLAIAACCLLTSVRNWALLGGAAVAVAAFVPGNGETVIEQRRGFFGIVKTVDTTDVSGRVRRLIHGRVMHGFQYSDPVRQAWPTAYYARPTAAGRALSAEASAPRHVGVVGLGVGTLAAYGREGDRFRFYEINRDVIDMARRHFQFLSLSKAEVSIAEGDARLRLSMEPPQGFDVLVIDAFSSDAIPAHLLTREAMQVYRRHLRPGGTLLVHISNRYADLAPVVRGMEPGAFRVTTPGDPVNGVSEASWMVAGDDGVRAMFSTAPQPPARVWTDDFSSVFAIWKLRGE